MQRGKDQIVFNNEHVGNRSDVKGDMSLNLQPPPKPFYGWRMVALAFLAFNLGLGVVMNSLGPALPVLQRELGASRADVSMTFGLLLLTMGLMAPLVGNVTQKVKLRTLMMLGSAVIALGFLLLAF